MWDIKFQIVIMKKPTKHRHCQLLLSILFNFVNEIDVWHHCQRYNGVSAKYYCFLHCHIAAIICCNAHDLVTFDFTVDDNRGG